MMSYICICVFGDEEDDLSLSIYHKGKLLKESNKTLKDLEIFPQTKLLAMGSGGIINKVVRIEDHKKCSWFYDTSSRDGVSFKVNKPIRIIGLGLYCPDKKDE